jgi:hypothetical protein
MHMIEYTHENGPTGDLYMVSGSLYHLQPLQDKDSALQSTYGVLSAPEEHLTARNIINTHAYRQTQSVN